MVDVAVNRMNHIRLLDKDPFKHAAYADTIDDDMGLKTLHYLQAITLYQDGCISDWHLKYVNGLISMRQHKKAYNHIALYYKNVRGINNSLLIKAANYQFKHKKYFVASKLYEKVNNNMIWKKRLNSKMAICYRETAKYTESIKYFKRHLHQQAEDKNNIKTYIQLANVYHIKGKYNKALDIYTNKLTKQHIEEHRLYTEIARCYYHQNDFEMSLLHLNQELSRFEYGKTRNIALYYKGIILSRKCEMYQESLKCFKSVDATSLPSNRDIDNELGFVYFRLNEFDLSLKYYRECIKNNETDSWFAYRNMAMIHWKRGNYRKALQLYEKLYKMIHKSKRLSKSEKENLKVNKLNLPYLFGVCCYSLGQYKAALKHFLMAMKGSKQSKHESIYVLKQIGYIYHYKLNKYKKACKCYDKLDDLKEIDKSDMEFYYSDCLQKLGKYENAFVMMQRYLDKYTDSVRCLNKMVILNMIGVLKHDEYCDILIKKALSIDANALYTNYIYAFHLNIIRKASPNGYLKKTQSLIDDRHQHEGMDMTMCVDIATLYTLFDVGCASEMKLFESSGLNHFEWMLSLFPDNSVVHILYAHFLSKCNKLCLLDAFHIKVMTEYKLSGNTKYICTRMRAYAMALNKIGRIGFGIEMTKTMKNKNCFVYNLNLGILYSLKKDYNICLTYLQKSLDINAMDFEANAFYGDILFKLGKVSESVVYFKVAFSPNGKQKKYFHLEFLVNYVKGMCIIEGYDYCITELSRILMDNIGYAFSIAIHRLIIEIYGKCNYNCDWNAALQHLKAIYQWKAQRVTSAETRYCRLI